MEVDYLRYIITPSGQLMRYEQSSGDYYQIESAPPLRLQWIGEDDAYTVTVDGEIYNIYFQQIVALPNPDVKVNRVLTNIYTGYPPPHCDPEEVFFISDDNTLYHLREGESEDRNVLTKLVEGIEHCAGYDGAVIGCSTVVGLFLVRLEDSSQVERMDCDGKIDTIINGVVLSNRLPHFSRSCDYLMNRINIPIQDIIFSFKDVEINDGSVPAYIYVISEGQLYGMSTSGTRILQRLDNELIEELELCTPWVRLVHITSRIIGVINDLGEVYALKDSYIKRLRIDRSLIVPINAKKSLRD